MAGTVTQTDPFPIGDPETRRGVRRVVLDWTSDASGNVSVPTRTPVYGAIFWVNFIPGTAADQPSNLHSVQLLDAAGLDVLSGFGSSLSNAAAKSGKPTNTSGDTTALRPVSETLTLTVSGAGVNKRGQVVLYV